MNNKTKRISTRLDKLAWLSTFLVISIALFIAQPNALADDLGNTDIVVGDLGDPNAQPPIPPELTCMQDIAGIGLNCTANDVSIANVTNLLIAPADPTQDPTDPDGPRDECSFPGDTITFTADFEVLLTAQARHDVGMYFATDGDPNGDGAVSGTCTIGTPAWAPDPPWLDLDGTTDKLPGTNVVSNIQDTCGDIDDEHNPLFPTMTVTAVCVAGLDGNLSLPYCTSWRQPGANDLCTSPIGAFPGTASKCKCDEGFTIPIRIPAFITVDKVTQDSAGNPLPGDPTEFSFSITGPDDDLPDNFSLADADPIHTSPNLDVKDSDGSVIGPYQVTENGPRGLDTPFSELH